VFAHVNGDSKLVSGDLVSENKESWGIATVTRDESWALRQGTVVGVVIVGLDSTRSNVTITVKSVLHGRSVEWRESGENWALEGSWKEAKVNTVEVFVFSLRAVEVDISLWVFFIKSSVDLNRSLDVLAIAGSSVFTVSVVKGSIDLISRYVVWHKESSSNDSRILPSLASVRVDSVVDGDIGFTE